MIKVYQSIIDKGDGDCQRAAVASILDLTLEQVPHFIRFGNDYHRIFRGFIKLFGWEYAGTCGILAPRGLKQKDSINGVFLCSVPSLTFDNVMHGILIDKKGNCLHDPNPNKRYDGINIYEIKDRRETITWSMFEKYRKA